MINACFNFRFMHVVLPYRSKCCWWRCHWENRWLYLQVYYPQHLPPEKMDGVAPHYMSVTLSSRRFTEYASGRNFRMRRGYVQNFYCKPGILANPKIIQRREIKTISGTDTVNHIGDYKACVDCNEAKTQCSKKATVPIVKGEWRDFNCHSRRRGFLFEQMPDSNASDPSKIISLDNLMQQSLKCVQLPKIIVEKMGILLRHMGSKKTLESIGRLLSRRLTARTCVEAPRVLPSTLMPEAQKLIEKTQLQRKIDNAALQARRENPYLSDSEAAIVGVEESGGWKVCEKGRKFGVDKGYNGNVEGSEVGARDEYVSARETSISALDFFENPQSPAMQAYVAQHAVSYAEDQRHPLYRHLNVTHSPATAATLAAHRLPAVYASLLRVLSEIKMRCPDLKPRRVLDVNANFGAGILAVDAIYGRFSVTDTRSITEGKNLSQTLNTEEDKEKASSVFDLVLGIEPSVHMSRVGRYLTADIKENVQWQRALYDEGLLFKRYKGKDSEHSVDDQFDLILAPHALLQQTSGQESREVFCKTLWARLKVGGLLVLLEAGTPTGFRVISLLREMFIRELGLDKFHIVAPCSHEGVCPMGLTGKDWCHFSQPVQRLPHAIYCKGSRAKSIEYAKFSFLVLRKKPGPRFDLPYHKYQHALQKLKVEQENNEFMGTAHYCGSKTEHDIQKQNCKGAQNECVNLSRILGIKIDLPLEVLESYYWPRIVCPPMKCRQHCVLDVCSHPNNFERICVSKNMPLSAGYKIARKSSWGDLWRYPRKLIRPNARAYIDANIADALSSQSHSQDGSDNRMERMRMRIRRFSEEDDETNNKHNREMLDMDLSRHFGT